MYNSKLVVEEGLQENMEYFNFLKKESNLIIVCDQFLHKYNLW